MKLADFIEANTKAIGQDWETFARACSRDGTGWLALQDHIDEILTAVAADMRAPQDQAAQAEKGKGKGASGPLDAAGRGHAAQRGDLGLTLAQVAAEIRALRASVVRLWEQSSPEVSRRDLGDMIRFNEALDQVLIQSMTVYGEQITRTREQFLAIVEHDLRSPLGVIVVSAGLIRRRKDVDPQSAKNVDRILGSATRMQRLLDDLVDLTRARFGTRIPIAPGPVDLAILCPRVLDALHASHPDRVLRFAPSGDLRGEWDGDRVAQALSNLVTNALRYGAPAAAPIVVSAEPRGAGVALAVHNEGPVIGAEDRDRIFEPWKRAERSKQVAHPGSLGLGLFIVREIATAHGGEVRVTSSAEEGTTFTMCLPRRPGEPDVAA